MRKVARSRFTALMYKVGSLSNDDDDSEDDAK